MQSECGRVSKREATFRADAQSSVLMTGVQYCCVLLRLVQTHPSIHPNQPLAGTTFPACRQTSSNSSPVCLPLDWRTHRMITATRLQQVWTAAAQLVAIQSGAAGVTGSLRSQLCTHHHPPDRPTTHYPPPPTPHHSDRPEPSRCNQQQHRRGRPSRDRQPG